MKQDLLAYPGATSYTFRSTPHTCPVPIVAVSFAQSNPNLSKADRLTGISLAEAGPQPPHLIENSRSLSLSAARRRESDSTEPGRATSCGFGYFRADQTFLGVGWRGWINQFIYSKERFDNVHSNF